MWKVLKRKKLLNAGGHRKLRKGEVVVVCREGAGGQGGAEGVVGICREL